MQKEGDNQFTVTIRTRVPRPWKKIIEVIDCTTGEVLLAKADDDIDNAFASGETICRKELTIRRDVNENGAEFRQVYGDGGQDYCQGWVKPLRRARIRGGAKSYTKIYPDKFNLLTDKQQLALFKLSGFVKTDGLIADNGKRRAATVEQIFGAWGVANSSGYKMLGELKTLGVIRKEDGGYFINKDFMGRG